MHEAEKARYALLSGLYDKSLKESDWGSLDHLAAALESSLVRLDKLQLACHVSLQQVQQAQIAGPVPAPPAVAPAPAVAPTPSVGCVRAIGSIFVIMSAGDDAEDQQCRPRPCVVSDIYIYSRPIHSEKRIPRVVDSLSLINS